MIALFNKITFTSITAILICLLMANTAMATTLHRCDWGKINYTIHNEALSPAHRPNPSVTTDNNIGFVIGERLLHYINNRGGTANNRIFRSIEKAISVAYQTRLPIEAWTTSSAACFPNTINESDMTIIFKRQV